MVFFGGGSHITIQCGTCGVWHTVPEVMYQNAEREGGWWHCPNGHSRGWKDGSEKTEIAQLRRERDRLLQQAAQKDDEIADERRRANAAEKKAAKIKKRAEAGVCQCCNRTFTNVARHMKSKHPNVIPLEQKAAK